MHWSSISFWLPQLKWDEKNKTSHSKNRPFKIKVIAYSSSSLTGSHSTEFWQPKKMKQGQRLFLTSVFWFCVNWLEISCCPPPWSHLRPLRKWCLTAGTYPPPPAAAPLALSRQSPISSVCSSDEGQPSGAGSRWALFKQVEEVTSK